MFILRSTVACFIAAAAVSEASNLRQGQRQLQTYTASDDYFSAMLVLVNKERAAQNLSPLCTNKKLQNAAQEHSDDQAANDYMDHMGSDGSNFQDRVTNAGFEWSSVAENVAAGQPDVASVMATWMTSPGHRENILGDYTRFGVAYAYNANSEFQHYWTQDFGTGDAEGCDGATEPVKAITDLTASSEADVMELTDVHETEVVDDSPVMVTTTEAHPESNGAEEDCSQTDAPATEEPEETPVVVVDPIDIGTPAPEEVYTFHDTPIVEDPDTYPVEVPEETPVVVVDPIDIGTSAPEEMYTSHDTPIVEDPDTYAVELPEEIPDLPEVRSPTPEVHTSYDTPSVHEPATYAPHKDCESGI